jgi:hypothetical protein
MKAYDFTGKGLSDIICVRESSEMEVWSLNG